MNDEEIEQAQVDVIIRSLDAWFLMSPTIVHDAVIAWLESVEGCQCEQVEDLVLEGDASEIG